MDSLKKDIGASYCQEREKKDTVLLCVTFSKGKEKREGKEVRKAYHKNQSELTIYVELENKDFPKFTPRQQNYLGGILVYQLRSSIGAWQGKQVE